MKKVIYTLLFILSVVISATNTFAQVTANPPSDIYMCDDNNDGLAIFDLTITEPEIIGGQNPTNLTVSFYVTQADADSNVNVIVVPNAYNNTINPQTIYARLENNTTGEFDTTNFTLIVNSSPIITVPTPLEACDDDGLNDGFSVFDLQSKNSEITGGNPNLEVTYHETEADAIAGVFLLATPYVNSVPFSQTLFVRVLDIIYGCFVITTLDLIVLPIPETITVSDLIAVDENGDGFTVFDLTTKDLEILNGQNNVDVSYFVSIQDANNGVNVIANPNSFINTTNPQTIYGRLESIETSCFAVTEFDLITVEAIIDEEPEDITIDEGDDNGFAIFDLTVNEPQMLGDQDPLVFLFTYHVTQEDAINGANSILTPNAYENIINPQTIYVRLTNSNTDFYVLTNFKIITDGNLNVEDKFLSSLKLYPNPATEIVNLKINNSVDKISITIYNFLGQELTNYERLLDNGTTPIDLSELNSGIYSIKIASSENSTIKKVVKN